ncbi:hypothetical protein TNCV_4186891 [Trichonephila clavipes]|nr:hypothetical protein TNCV_4186891 [Trichonephila clavipes]
MVWPCYPDQLAGALGGHDSVVVKITNSWLACHEFGSSTTKEPHEEEVDACYLNRGSKFSRCCDVEERREWCQHRYWRAFATDLASLKDGQVTRTTLEQAPPPGFQRYNGRNHDTKATSPLS